MFRNDSLVHQIDTLAIHLSKWGMAAAQKLPLELIEAFVVFAASENMSSAAEQLGLTQPAISQRLQRFEALWAISPFSVRGKRKVLKGALTVVQ